MPDLLPTVRGQDNSVPDDVRESIQLEKLRALKPLGSEPVVVRKPLVPEKMDAKTFGKEIEEEVNEKVRSGDKASGNHCDSLITLVNEVAQQDKTSSTFVLSQSNTPLQQFVAIHLKAKNLKRLLAKIAVLADVCQNRSVTVGSNVDVQHDEKGHWRSQVEIQISPEHLDRRKTAPLQLQDTSPLLAGKVATLAPIGSTAAKRSKAAPAQNIQEKMLQDGAIYRGELVDVKPHGYGTVQYSDSDAKQRVKFAGEFEHGIRKGLGCLTWKDGAQYAGDWFSDKPCGFGVENYPDGSSYVGQYEEDMRQGFGTYTFPSGGKYEGCWLNGKRHGKGLETSKKGTCIAIFEENKRMSQEEYASGRDPEFDRMLAQIRAAVDKGRICGNTAMTAFEKSFQTKLRR